jgi:hypothetical protein
MLQDLDWVRNRLAWMREQRIWPNGLRYLWTDAFGVVLLVSLYDELKEERYLQEAEWVVSEVDRVLGRPRGVLHPEGPGHKHRDQDERVRGHGHPGGDPPAEGRGRNLSLGDHGRDDIARDLRGVVPVESGAYRGPDGRDRGFHRRGTCT